MVWTKNTRAEGRITLCAKKHVPKGASLRHSQPFCAFPFLPLQMGAMSTVTCKGCRLFFFCKGRRRCRGDPEKEEEEEEEDLFVFNDTIEGPRERHVT